MEKQPRKGSDLSKVSLALAVVALLVSGGAIGLFLTAPQATTREPQRIELRVLLVAAHMEGAMVEEQHYWTPGTIVAHIGDVLHITFLNMDEHNHSLAIPALGMESPKVAGMGNIYEFADVTLARTGTFLIVCATPYVPPNDCGEDHGEIVGQLVVLA